MIISDFGGECWRWVGRTWEKSLGWHDNDSTVFHCQLLRQRGHLWLWWSVGNSGITVHVMRFGWEVWSWGRHRSCRLLFELFQASVVCRILVFFFGLNVSGILIWSIWHGLRHVRSEQDPFGEGCVTGGWGGYVAWVRWLSPEQMVTAFLMSFCIVFLWSCEMATSMWVEHSFTRHDKTVFHISSWGAVWFQFCIRLHGWLRWSWKPWLRSVTGLCKVTWSNL